MFKFLFSGKNSKECVKYKDLFMDIDEKYKDKVLSMDNIGNNLIVGREDGKLQIINENMENSNRIECFKKEFDLLDNEHVKEGITSIEILNEYELDKTLFISNVREIKVMKLREKISVVDFIKNKGEKNRANIDKIRKNKVFYSQKIDECNYVAKEICNFPNSHKYNINSLSLNASNEFLIASDLLKINMIKPERMDFMYTVVDIKEKLDAGCIYVINSSKFSKVKDTMFGYGTSQGDVCIHDIKVDPKNNEICRLNNTIISKQKINMDNIEQNDKNSDIKSIVDFVFLDENKIASRTLNKVSLFDIRNTNMKLMEYNLFEINDKMVESDIIYEKFKMTHLNGVIYTGTLSGEICVIDTNGSKNIKMNVSKVGNDLSIQNAIKHVHAYDNTLCCVNDGRIIKYKIDEINKL